MSLVKSVLIIDSVNVGQWAGVLSLPVETEPVDWSFHQGIMA